MAVANVIYLIRRQGQSVFAQLALRRCLHYALYAFYDVICVGEVSLAVAVVKDFNGFSCQQLVRKAKVRHVRTACRTIYGEEAQSG